MLGRGTGLRTVRNSVFKRCSNFSKVSSGSHLKFFSRSCASLHLSLLRAVPEGSERGKIAELPLPRTLSSSNKKIYFVRKWSVGWSVCEPRGYCVEQCGEHGY